MSQPKGQHTIPVILLRRFTDPSEKLHFFRKDWNPKRIEISSPKNLFKEEHIYTVTDPEGKKDTSLEAYYSDLEHQTAPILDTLTKNVKGKNFPLLDDKERYVFIRFLYHQMKRVPEFHAPAISFSSEEAAIDHTIGLLRNSSLSETNEIRSYLQSDGTMDRILQNAKVEALSIDSKEVLELLASITIGALHIQKNNKAFVIGSPPILAFSENSKITHPKTEILLPIASDIAICLTYNTEQKIIVPTDTMIRRLNLYMARQCQMVAGCSKTLIDSLMHPR